MVPKEFWKHLARYDKDTFIFGAVFAVVMIGVFKVGASEIFISLTGAGFIILYIIMRIALLKVQLMEQEAKLKRSPSRRAKEIVDANATKSEKVALDKFRSSVKTKQK